MKVKLLLKCSHLYRRRLPCHPIEYCVTAAEKERILNLPISFRHESKFSNGIHFSFSHFFFFLQQSFSISQNGWTPFHPMKVYFRLFFHLAEKRNLSVPCLLFTLSSLSSEARTFSLTQKKARRLKHDGSLVRGLRLALCVNFLSNMRAH